MDNALSLCSTIHPGLGLYRFFIGGMKLLKESFLDAVYYFMSAMDCTMPYNTREQLLSAFGQSYRFQYKLEEKKRNKEEVENYDVRVFISRFIRAIECIWTNVDIDKCPAYFKHLSTSLSILIAQWCNKEVRLPRNILPRLMTILLMTIQNCMKEIDPRGAHAKAIEKMRQGECAVVLIDERDSSRS